MLVVLYEYILVLLVLLSVCCGMLKGILAVRSLDGLTFVGSSWFFKASTLSKRQSVLQIEVERRSMLVVPMQSLWLEQHKKVYFY